MKKFLLALMIIALTTGLAFSKTVVPKGVIVQVYAKKPISTETYQEGDPVYFVNPTDVFSGENKVFPRNTIFVGYISFLKMPVQGINGAFRGAITHLILPDGTEHNIGASLQYRGGQTFGGELTPPASYNKSVHPTRGWTYTSGTLQWVPSGEYEFGKHRVLNTKEAVFILLEDDYVPN